VSRRGLLADTVVGGGGSLQCTTAYDLKEEYVRQKSLGQLSVCIMAAVDLRMKQHTTGALHFCRVTFKTPHSKLARSNLTECLVSEAVKSWRMDQSPRSSRQLLQYRCTGTAWDLVFFCEQQSAVRFTTAACSYDARILLSKPGMSTIHHLVLQFEAQLPMF
jgi:hypothetical protein